jgi:hypothetical protein
MRVVSVLWPMTVVSVFAACSKTRGEDTPGPAVASSGGAMAVDGSRGSTDGSTPDVAAPTLVSPSVVTALADASVLDGSPVDASSSSTDAPATDAPNPFCKTLDGFCGTARLLVRALEGDGDARSYLAVADDKGCTFPGPDRPLHCVVIERESRWRKVGPLEYSLGCSWGGTDFPYGGNAGPDAVNPPPVELPRAHAAWKKCLPDFETEALPPAPWPSSNENGYQVPSAFPPTFRKHVATDAGRLVLQIVVEANLNNPEEVLHGSEPGWVHGALRWHYNVTLDTDPERLDAGAADTGGG